MEIKDTYHTIAAKSEGLFKDKGSKFLAFAYPVSTEDEIKSIIQHIKKEHYSARHHCYAYRLGSNGELYRANDDGEPSGTAGRPILGQLLSHELTNVLIVVVRYFGGTLLGVSGLINAYKNAAIEAINNACIEERIVENQFLLHFAYPVQNSISKVIKDYNLEVINSEFTFDCKYTIAVRLNIEEAVLSQLEKIEGLSITKVVEHVI